MENRRSGFFRSRIRIGRMAPQPNDGQPLPRMTRLVSFAVLLGLVALFGLLSLRVMASFLLPLLLAAMLVVIFGPLHRRLRDRLGLADWMAAGLTTLIVLVIVLAPLGLLVTRAVADAMGWSAARKRCGSILPCSDGSWTASTRPPGSTSLPTASTPNSAAWRRTGSARLPPGHRLSSARP